MGIWEVGRCSPIRRAIVVLLFGSLAFVMAVSGVHAQVPEIEVQGDNSTVINSGDAPSLLAGTDYGSVGIGSSGFTTFFVVNLGSADLTLGNPQLSGAHAGDFTVYQNPVSPVPAGFHTEFAISFNPSASGLRTATVTFTNNDGDENPFTFQLQGTGSAAPASFTIAGGDNQSAAINAAFADPLVVTVLDGSNNPVPGVSITFTPPNQGGGPVPGATLSQTTLSTDANGQASVTATANGLVGSYQVRATLGGFGELFFDLTNVDAGPEIEVRGNNNVIANQDSSPSLADGTDFGNVAVANTGTSTFTIFNRGSSDLTLSAASITGNPGEFVVTQQPASPVPPGGQTQLAVAFTPAVAALRTARVTMTTNDPDENESVTFFDIRGTGVASDVTPPRVNSLVRHDPASQNTDADTLTWRLTFDEAVQNVDDGDFIIAGVAGGTISVTPVSPTVYDITISGGDLPVLNDSVLFGYNGAQDIADLAGNPLANTVPTGSNEVEYIVANATPAPGFSKSFNPDTVVAVHVNSLLTYTIDNSGSTQPAANLDFTHNLPADVRVNAFFPAVPLTTCTGGTLTAAHASGTVSYTGGTVAAGATCTVSVGVNAFSAGTHPSTTGNLTSSLGNSGPASATLTAIQGIPDAQVEGGSPPQPIAAGDTTPDAGDGTDFGSVDIAGFSRDHTFTIRNTGNGQLNIEPTVRVTISGANAGDFSVINQPAHVIGPFANSAFTIRFNPSATGLRTATVSFNSNDADESPYSFAIQGTGIDTDAPRVSQIDQILGGSPTQDDEVIWRIIFTEHVVNLDLSDFTVSGTTATLSVRTPPVDNPGFGTLIDLRLSGGDLAGLNGNVTLSLAPGQDIADHSGNPLVNDTPVSTDERVVQIINVDPDIRITGDGTNPFINTGPDIVSGQTATSVADGTDFGGILVGQQTPRHNFSVSNTVQYSTLTADVSQAIVSGPAAGDFIVTGSSTLALSGLATSGFTINFRPTAVGVRDAVITIVSNDPDENPFTFNITGIGLAGAPENLAATGGTPQAQTINSAFADVLEATVTDSGGNPVNGVSVAFTAPSNGASGSFAGGSATATAVTNASGIAVSPVFTANSVAGGYSVVASSPGLPDVSFSLTNNAGPAATLEIASGSPQSAALNSAYANNLTVRIVDGGGNPVSGETVTFEVPAAGASAVLSSLTATTDANGLASVSATANAIAGTYTVNASAGALGPVAFQLTNRIGPSVEETQAVISDFMLNRANHILGNQPDLLGIMNGGGAGRPADLNISGSDQQLALGFATSRSRILASRQASAEMLARIDNAFNAPDGIGGESTSSSDGLVDPRMRASARDKSLTMHAESVEYLQRMRGEMRQPASSAHAFAPGMRTGSTDVWTQLSAVRSDSGPSDATLMVGFIGAHTFISENNVVGVYGQFDWAEETNSSVNSHAEGFGWMVGPYLAGQLSSGSLSYELRAAYGRSDNNVSPDGTFTDGFETERFMISGRLSGALALTNTVRVTPSISLSWFEETQQAYVDSLTQSIPEQTISLGEIRFGPEFTRAVALDNGMEMQASLGASGVWNFDVSGNDAAQGFPLGSNDLRARIDAGIDLIDPATGMRFSLEAYLDGLGLSDFESYGGSLRLVIPVD